MKRRSKGPWEVDRWRVRAGRELHLHLLDYRSCDLQTRCSQSCRKFICYNQSINAHQHIHPSSTYYCPTTMTATLPPSLSPLFARDPNTIPLVPSKPFDATLTSTITDLAKQHDWSDRLVSSLHLLNDDVSRAHDIVTDREDDQGCCVVHAILHRRGEWRTRAIYRTTY